MPKIHLTHLLSNLPVELLSGNRVIEVKPYGVNKGLVVPKVLAAWPKALVIAAGDDETDEYLFRASPEESLSFCVGARPSAARFTLSGVAALRSLLRDATNAARAAR